MQALDLIPEIAGGPELRVMLQGLVQCRRRTMEMIAETIQRAVQFGRRLIELKGKLEHGLFVTWLQAEQIVGEGEDQISWTTARRWMALAKFDAKNAGELDKASSVTSAYKLAGLLPDPEASTRPAGGTNPVETISGLLQQLEEQPLTQMPREQLEALDAVLERLRALQERVRETLEGHPPQEGISFMSHEAGV